MMHKNGNSRDCRWKNLLAKEHMYVGQNSKTRYDNTTWFRGVSFDRCNKKYRAYIGINNKLKRLGYFDSALEAAKARLAAEIKEPDWLCNYRAKIVEQIKAADPEFSLDDFIREVLANG